MIRVPRSLDEVDAAWMSAALGTRVESLSPTGPLAGLVVTCAAARFRLTGDGPDTVVVKLGTHDDKGMNAREICTYRELAEAPLPHCWFAEHDGTRSVLVLEDLSPLHPGHPITGATEAQTIALLDQIAGWQRAWWTRTGIWPDKVLPDGVSHGQRVSGGWARLDRDRFPASPDTARAIEAITRDMPHHLDLLARSPASLVHCDLHAENVWFDGDRVIVLDWQNTTRGPAAIDVAGALTCAAPGVIENGWEALLEHYRRRLGVWPDGPAALHHAVRAAVAYQAGAIAWLADNASTTDRTEAAMRGHWDRLSTAARVLG